MTHFCDQSRKGRFRVGRKGTSGKGVYVLPLAQGCRHILRGEQPPQTGCRTKLAERILIRTPLFLIRMPLVRGEPGNRLPYRDKLLIALNSEGSGPGA